MVGALVDQFVDVRIRVHGMRAGKVRAGDELPEMAVDRIREKPVAMLVPVEPPRIHRAMADDLEDLALRMIAPDAAIERHAVVRRRLPGAATRPGALVPQRP